jgi:hypothetical protein
MCTTFVNIQEPCISSTLCVSVCHMILTMNSDCFHGRHGKLLVFVMEMQYVYCEV